MPPLGEAIVISEDVTDSSRQDRWFITMSFDEW
jgi:hypothetical protein